MKANTLLTTTNYNMFRLADYNRNVEPQHVQQLINEAKAGHKFLQPVIVNEKMEVIDGQHRLKAIQELKQPVEYIIKPGTGKDDVISMNNTQKSWSPKAWIQSYANAGNRNYQALLQEVDKPRKLTVSPNLLAKLFADPYATANQDKPSVRTGKFKFDYQNAPHAEKVVNDAISLTEEYRRGHYGTLLRSILESLWILESKDKFDFDYLFKKMTEDEFDNAAQKENPRDAVLSLLKVYNRRNRKGQIFAHKDAHGHLVFE